MLFLGTSKFPDEAEYKRFINAHGGSCNASTSMEHTNYHFQIDCNFLEGALERFSQFFISPLFEQSATDRELNAIHSEFSKVCIIYCSSTTVPLYIVKYIHS